MGTQAKYRWKVIEDIGESNGQNQFFWVFAPIRVVENHHVRGWWCEIKKLRESKRELCQVVQKINHLIKEK